MAAAAKLLIAGGGTGGHLFPGLAVAREFLGRDPGHRVLFVGTAQGIEARAVPQAGLDLALIPSQGIAGLGLARKLKGVLVIPRSFLAARRVVKDFGPDLALGVGGYVSGPVMVAARLHGAVTAIHEQNARPGYANRILSRLVQRVFVSFDAARAGFPRAEAAGKVRVVGNPARRDIVDALEAGWSKRESDPQRLRLLVVGGSQGAHGLNLLLTAAMAELDEGQRGRLTVVHQSGERDREMVEQRYREAGVSATVKTFIDDMSAAYLAADLIVSRSGAGAVAEIALAGLPAILVPFPAAASDHQAVNARVLTDAGAALLMREGETDGAALARALAEIMDDPARREDMARAARSAARPRAAAEIVDGLLELRPGRTTQ